MRGGRCGIVRACAHATCKTREKRIRSMRKAYARGAESELEKTGNVLKNAKNARQKPKNVLKRPENVLKNAENGNER